MSNQKAGKGAIYNYSNNNIILISQKWDEERMKLHLALHHWLSSSLLTSCSFHLEERSDCFRTSRVFQFLPGTASRWLRAKKERKLKRCNGEAKRRKASHQKSSQMSLGYSSVEFHAEHCFDQSTEKPPSLATRCCFAAKAQRRPKRNNGFLYWCVGSRSPSLCLGATLHIFRSLILVVNWLKTKRKDKRSTERTSQPQQETRS